MVPSRSEKLVSSSNFAVKIATTMIPISGRADKRVQRPIKIKKPKISSKPLTIGA